MSDADELEPVDRAHVFSSALGTFAQLCLRLLIIGATGFALWTVITALWPGLLPLAVALLLSSVLWTPVAWLRRHSVPASLAALLSMVAILAALSLIVVVVVPGVSTQWQTIYFQAVQGVQTLQLWLQGPPLNIAPEDLNTFFGEALQWMQNQAGSIAGGVFAGLGRASSAVFNTFVVLMLTFFMLKDGPRFLPWLSGFTGQKIGWHVTEVLTRAWTTLSGYIRAQAAVSCIDAVLIGLGLVIMKIPLALALAALTFIAGFVPIIGAIVAGIVAILVALVTFGLGRAIAVLLLVLAVQQLEGNVLSPLLQSRAMHLHPGVVIVSVAVGSSLFGIVGAFLAVPVVAMLAVLLRYLSDLTALASGEKTADDIAFATSMGKASGQRTQRNRFRDTLPVDVDALLSRLQDASANVTQMFRK
ncbi:MAG: AI-2E family transporter [Corynebacterium sp.]|nr:AI-2E family transporter [Corynebacterium sp.]